MAWSKAEAEQQYVIDIDDVAFSYFVADMLPTKIACTGTESGRGHVRWFGGRGPRCNQHSRALMVGWVRGAGQRTGFGIC